MLELQASCPKLWVANPKSELESGTPKANLEPFNLFDPKSEPHTLAGYRDCIWSLLPPNLFFECLHHLQNPQDHYGRLVQGPQGPQAPQAPQAPGVSHETGPRGCTGLSRGNGSLCQSSCGLPDGDCSEFLGGNCVRGLVGGSQLAERISATGLAGGCQASGMGCAYTVHCQEPGFWHGFRVQGSLRGTRLRV